MYPQVFTDPQPGNPNHLVQHRTARPDHATSFRFCKHTQKTAHMKPAFFRSPAPQLLVHQLELCAQFLREDDCLRFAGIQFAS